MKILNFIRKMFRTVFKRKRNFSLILNSKNAQRLLFWGRMRDLIDGVGGDVVECGVGKARSFQMLAFLFENSSRKLFGFDSFQGFPEPSIEDESVRNPQKGEWNLLTPNRVREILSLAGVGESFIEKTELVSGFFEDTLVENKLEKIALLHLDVDLYDSYRACLKYLYFKVSPGGVIVFDEYEDEIKWPGAKKAIDEFLQENRFQVKKDDVVNKYYLIKPR